MSTIRRRRVPSSELAAECARLSANGARLLTFLGTDERARHGHFGLYAAFIQTDGQADGQTTLLESAVDGLNARYPSVTSQFPATHWDERELHDMLGVEAVGHPHLARLVFRDEWPANLFPLRKDFDAGRVPPQPRDLEYFEPTPVDGSGVVSVPVGPIHAGIIEPGHFRFAAVGEIVLRLDAQLFYTHRGIEKLAEGRSVESALQVAERTCGACAFSHGLAFSEAVESLSNVAIPPRAAWARTLLLELERLYNHLGDSGNICAGVGFSVGAMAGAQLKEELQRLNERLVGHRFLRGACAPGGLRRDLSIDGLSSARGVLADLRERSRRFGDMVLATESLIERARTTGILKPEWIRDLGGVGVAARASGVDVDLRRDRPTERYGELAAADVLRVPIQSSGDAEARLRQRLDEAEVSFAIADRLLADVPSGPTRAPLGDLRSGEVGIGAAESPRGANVHAVMLAEDGTVDRLRIRSASFPNWPLVPLTVPGNLVPDFPLINKSFELCYACLDR